MTDNSAVPLIVFSPQREPSEFINSLMRRAGEPVHCTWIPAVRDLGEALEQLNPELLICAYVSESEAKQAATVRDQLAPQVPMLLVRPQISEGDIASGMRIGARDVVSLSATDRVQAVISRELRSFRLERAAWRFEQCQTPCGTGRSTLEPCLKKTGTGRESQLE